MAKGKRQSRGRPRGGPGRASPARPGTLNDESPPRRWGGPVIPSIVMVPVGLAVGWFVADWLGAALGGIIGALLWRSRA